jgi:hypothetical protein
MSFELDYEELVYLDAEGLAETGIKEAYDALLPELRKYLPAPAAVEEIIDNGAPRYAVFAEGVEYLVYSSELDSSEGRSWGRATYIFFQIVNAQLSGSTHRFYAFYGGNDLGGMFLTSAEAELASGSLASKAEWPYLPTMDHPWYGQER